METYKPVITTHHVHFHAQNSQDVLGLVPCTHEVTDTCMLLYLENAVWQGHSKVSICTIDIEDVVRAITSAQGQNTSEL